MTTMIDHAIAIPTRTVNVWEQIRDIHKNPIWQPDCKQVQFLTSNQNGRGARWRSTTAHGKEQVFEITAWYEGLGYEYRIVDGVPFASNRGRIRLQDSPEGTIVQWTFTYELKGILSGIRNTLGVKNAIDNEIIDGLRNLYTHVKNLKADETFSPEESKSYLQHAPDVTARSQYKPRYPSALESQANREESPSPGSTVPSMAKVPTIEEPPIAQEDTKPNPSVQPAAEIPVPKTEADDMFKPKTVQAEPLPRLDEPVEEETAVAPKATTTDTAPMQKPSTAVEPLSPGHEVSKLDTAKISVFEVFGLEKPSETERMGAIVEKPDEPTPAPKGFADLTPIKPDINPEVPRRRGLRAALRQKLTNVRLPK